MKFEDYEDFYVKVINEYIIEFLTFDSSYHALSVNKKAKKKIYNYYEKKRLDIRNNYMLDPSKPIDRHKTAAAMIYAILSAKVFNINYRIPHLPEPLKLANEYLAFYVAINIIDLYKRKDDLILRGNPDSKYKLIIPDTIYETTTNNYIINEGSSFVDSICLTLANIKNLNYFDLFSYSTILFLLEKILIIL